MPTPLALLGDQLAPAVTVPVQGAWGAAPCVNEAWEKGRASDACFRCVVAG